MFILRDLKLEKTKQENVFIIFDWKFSCLDFGHIIKYLKNDYFCPILVIYYLKHAD